MLLFAVEKVTRRACGRSSLRAIEVGIDRQNHLFVQRQHFRLVLSDVGLQLFAHFIGEVTNQLVHQLAQHVATSSEVCSTASSSSGMPMLRM